MKKITHITYIILSYLFFLFISHSVYADRIYRNEKVSITPRIYKDDILLYEIYISGEQSSRIVAYNTESQSIIWQRDFNVWTNLDDNGYLYFIKSNYLHKLEISTGEEILTINLDKYDWPQAKNLSRFAKRIRELKFKLREPALPNNLRNTYTKSLTSFRALSQSESISTNYQFFASTAYGIYVSRLISYESNNTRDNDIWAAIDSKSRVIKFYKKGVPYNARYLSNNKILFKVYSSNDLLIVDGDEIFKINEKLPVKTPPIYIYDIKQENSIYDKKLLFDYLYDYPQHNVAIYDSKNNNVTTVKQKHHHNEQIDFIIHDKHVIKYSTCVINTEAWPYLSDFLDSPVNEDETEPEFTTHDTESINATNQWIESYDFLGNRVTSTILGGSITNQTLEFITRTSKGHLVFLGQNDMGYNKEGHYVKQPISASILVIDFPSLKTIRRYSITQKKDQQNEICLLRAKDKDCLVQVLGNTLIDNIRTNSQPHRFTIRGIDIYSGKKLWQTKEDLKIPEDI